MEIDYSIFYSSIINLIKKQTEYMKKNISIKRK